MKYKYWMCSSLTSIIIPSSVTNIGVSAFQGCNALSSITIGGGVDKIYGKAFSKCSELRDVYCLADNLADESWREGLWSSSDAFEESYVEYATLHVPASVINAYKTMEPWSGFGSIVALDETQMPKCAMPAITFVNGELRFSCETEGVEFVSEVTVGDAKKYYGNRVMIDGTYTISVYATKEGYENSDVATMNFTPGGGKTGDLNKDGKVDISDIFTIIKILAGK